MSGSHRAGAPVKDNASVFEGDRVSDSEAFDFLFDSSTTSTMLFAREAKPLLVQFVEGVSAAMISFGHTGSGKTFTTDALMQYAAENVFLLLNERTAKMGGRLSFQITVQYVEIYNELVEDLFDPARVELSVAEDALLGPIVSEATLRDVHGPQQLLQLITEGREKRQRGTNAFGPTHPRTSAALILLLNQYTESSSMMSKLMIVDTPGLEKLAEDAEVLRAREGPTLHQSLFGLGNVIRDLSNPERADFAMYDSSTLTKLLRDALGGNCRTLAICTLGPHGASRYHPGKLAMMLRKVQNYPLVNDGTAVGLLRRYRLITNHLREELGASNVGGEATGDARLLLRLHEMEGKLIKEEIEKLKLKDEAEKIYQKLVELRDKYTLLMNQKTQLQQDLLRSEEERLQISKALIDLRIEHTTNAQGTEGEKFELTNKILTFENDIMEMEMKLEKANKKAAVMEEQLKEAQEEREAVQTEFVALKHNYLNAMADMQAEKTKNDELSLEVVNLVNANTALMDKQRAAGLPPPPAQREVERDRKRAESRAGSRAESRAGIGAADRDDVVRQMQALMQEQAAQYQQSIAELERKLEKLGAGSGPPHAMFESKDSGSPDKLRVLEAENANLKETLSELKRSSLFGGRGAAASAENSAELQQRISQLERENEELKQSLRSPMRGGGQSFNAQAEQEIVQLKAANAALKQKLAITEQGQQSDFMKKIRDMSAATQEDLERERLNLLARATMAEAQVEQMQEYMNHTLAEYQKEIARLRKQLQQTQQAEPGPRSDTFGRSGPAFPSAGYDEDVPSRMRKPLPERDPLHQPLASAPAPQRSRSALSDRADEVALPAPSMAWPERFPVRDSGSRR